MPYAVINGVNLHYIDKGRGKPIVLLHGVWMSSKFFEDQIERLSQDHRVIALDFRGHGQSQHTDSGHTVSQYAEDLKGLIDQLGVGAVALVGWSMGVFVIWEYLARYGTYDIASTVIIDESASDFKWDDWPHGFADLPTLIHLMEMVQVDQEAVVDQFLPLMFKDAPSAEMLAWMKPELLRVAPTTAGSILFDQTTRDYRQKIAAFNVPTLICFGRNEKLVPLAAAEHLLSQIKHSELKVFENSSHCPFLEEPEAFHKTLTDFVARH